MKLCIDCSEEIPEARLKLAVGTLRCVACQELHEVGWYEKQIRQNVGASSKKEKENKFLKQNIPSFFTCQLCNYKRNQYKDRPCAWCGSSGKII